MTLEIDVCEPQAHRETKRTGRRAFDDGPALVPAGHRVMVAKDFLDPADAKAENACVFGIDARPSVRSGVPLVETHWSRILYYNLFDAGAGDDTPRATTSRSWWLAPGALVLEAIRATSAIPRRAHAHWRQRRWIRPTYAPIEHLDDRALRDVGLHRGQLRVVAEDAIERAEIIRTRASM